MKKIIAGILAATVVFGAAATLTACGGGHEHEHEHIWDGGEITTAATCTSDGVKTYKCMVEGCNESYTEPVGKLSHDFSGDFVEVDGGHAKTCSGCGTVDSANTEEHNFTEDTEKRVDATCNSDGEIVFVCDDCGAEASQAITERPDHDFTGEWVAAGESGHVRQCADCDAVDSDIIAHTYSESFGHDENAHWQTCEDCGYKTEASAHNWDEGTVTVPPAFMQAGEKTYSCLDCGATKTEEVPATKTASFAEEFSIEEQLGAWSYGYVDYSWEGGESFEFHKIEALNGGGDGWQKDGVEIKGGWINADGMATVAYTVTEEITVSVKVTFTGGTENTRLALRIGVKNGEGILYGNPSFNADENSNLLNIEKVLTLNAGDTVYFIFSNEGKVEGAYPNGSLDIILTVQ